MSGGLLQIGRTQRFNLFRKLTHNFGKADAFGRGNPFQTQPVGCDSQKVNQLLSEMKHLFGFNITILVMAVTDMSAGDQNAVGPFLKRF